MKFNGIKALTLAAGLAAAALGLLPGVAAAQANLTIQGCSSLTYAGGTTFTCVPVTTTPGAPSGCSVSPPTNAIGSGGGTVSLVAGCTGGGSVATTTWTKNGSPYGGTFPDSLPANTGTTGVTYTYTATFCTSDNLCSSASATATVAAGSAPPPTSASCGTLKVIEPFLETSSTTKKLTFSGERFITSGFGSSKSTVVVAQIDVPSGISGPTTLAIYEYASSSTPRRAWLSQTRCDMTATAAPYFMGGNGPVFQIQVGGFADSTKVNMQPGETWYLMVKNEGGGRTGSITDSCSSGTCDIGIKLYKPL
jgi:hypothetical protein